MIDPEIDLDFFKSKLAAVGEAAEKSGNKPLVRLVSHYYRLAELEQAQNIPAWRKAA